MEEYTSDFKIHIGGINFSTKHHTLKKIFSQYGNVVHVSIPIHHDTQRIKGYAFITFDTPQAAQLALKHNDMIDGREVIINKAAPEKNSNKNYLEEIS